MDKGRTKRSGWTWGVIGGICGFVGILAALLGGLLTASTWVLGAELHPWLQNFATALLLSTIPLLIIAGYCLDWMERVPKKSVTEKVRHEERENKPTSHRTVAAVLLLTFCAAPVDLRVQQTIFNVPSSDVLDQGKVYGELDATFKPNNSDALNRFSSFVPRVVVGTGGRVEVGLNITGNINPGPDSTTLVPAIKWKAYANEESGVSIVIGDNAFIPVRNKSYDFGNYVYAQISKSFKSGTRLTAGGYHFSDHVVAANAQRAGRQFGFEQPITSRFGVAADWYTGKHAAGYFTPGINFKPHPRVTGYVGYSIGNTNASNGNHFVYTAIGINFN